MIEKQMLEEIMRRQETIIQALWWSNGLAVLGRLLEGFIAYWIAHDIANRIRSRMGGTQP